MKTNISLSEIAIAGLTKNEIIYRAGDDLPEFLDPSVLGYEVAHGCKFVFMTDTKVTRRGDRIFFEPLDGDTITLSVIEKS